MQWRVRGILVLVALAVWAAPGRAQVALQQRLSALPDLIGKPMTYARKGTESIFDIARRNDVSASMVNNANIGDLRAGNEILTLPTEHIAPLAKANGLVLNLPERNVYLYQNGRPVRVFPVAIGMRGWETPTGDFHIATKRMNPTWFPPKWAVQETPVPPGPDNPLGDRWMGLSIPGYGMHATNAPESIGRFASHGCIRMYPEDAHTLFGMVRIGTPVKIVYKVVVLGYRPETGEVYLVHHPDPYQLGDATVGDVLAALAEHGLADVADVDAITEALERPRGVPVPVVGSDTHVTVAGRPVKFALAPVRDGNDWLVPAAPLAQALGAQLEVDHAGSYAILARPGARVMLSHNSNDALVNGGLVQIETPMRFVAGYPLVPLKATASALGASVGWNDDTKTVLIWTPGLPGNPLSAASG